MRHAAAEVLGAHGVSQTMHRILVASRGHDACGNRALASRTSGLVQRMHESHRRLAVRVQLWRGELPITVLLLWP